MKSSKQILGSILRTAQIGQTDIQNALSHSMGPGLRRVLEARLQEYDSLENEALAIAGQRGWDLSELDPAFRYFSGVMTNLKLGPRHSDSRIADILIQDSTRAITRTSRPAFRSCERDSRIHILRQKLLDCETSNIHQMKRYL